ncbi:MAG: hypothetical protein UR66_C0018G0024 [Candidatus Moranbacteria bacterium GW2011_GWE1_35_17]|nr:MAG: hypothetical protein UR66_C0018G0024 [Candidatus Moranbacteria bacterium GW2011_GWE1_35_17]KKP83317.1 MAG: hypothetical protein UR82_C0022G0010 [Candidatus Moranbacteria bacterium GW2011_GWF1_35_5]KKP84709.1 MAG: hypothetical protein UR83_C0014G0012 [Candidatus Moranbacteria bacterium GW2011_GWF2_35_54]
MDIKTKIFWWTMGILILASFGATFYRYMIKKDYIVQAQVDCDPYSEVCFVWECDPESDVEGEMCTGDPEEDVWYFKVINKNASRIQTCDASDEDCNALVCAQNEPDCEFVFCTPENMEENYASSCIDDPAKYALENPIEEEESKCDEGDEECLESDEENLTGEESIEEEVVIESTESDQEIESIATNIKETEGITDIDEAENTEDSAENVSVEVANNESLSQEEIAQRNEDSGGALPIVE